MQGVCGRVVVSAGCVFWEGGGERGGAWYLCLNTASGEK